MIFAIALPDDWQTFVSSGGVANFTGDRDAESAEWAWDRRERLHARRSSNRDVGKGGLNG